MCAPIIMCVLQRFSSFLCLFYYNTSQKTKPVIRDGPRRGSGQFWVIYVLFNVRS